MHIGVLGNRGSWYCADLMRAAVDRGHRFSRLDFPRLTGRVGVEQASVVQSASDNQAEDEAVDPGPLDPGEMDLGALDPGEMDLGALDALIVRTMPPGSLEQVVYRMDSLWRLEAEGVQVVNSPKAVECAVDKYLTTVRLAAAGLPVPETIVCEDFDAAMCAFAELGGDVVVKPIFGSEGRGIVRVSDPDLAHRTFRTLERIQAVLYVQRYIEHGGTDVRVLTLDGRVLGAIRRSNAEDFRTNVARRGLVAVHEPDDLECDLALRAAEAVGARFAGVDLLSDASGNASIVEVNAVPGWRAFQRATEIDAATMLISALEDHTADC